MGMDKFGDQSLFAGSHDNVALAIHVKYTGGLNEIYSFAAVDEIKLSQGGYRVEEIHIAARLPKKQPQWTWEDKKAGRLPEVGATVEFNRKEKFYMPSHCWDWQTGDALEVIAVTSIKDTALVVVKNREEREYPVQSIVIDCLQPIETPEEKANRLREAFVSSCMKNKDQLLSQEFRLGLECAYDEMQRRNKESS